MYKRPCLMALALTLMLTAFGGAARASHYALADVPRLVKPGEVEKLKKANVGTTEDLLGKAAKPKDRKALAKTSGLPAADLLALAKRCDLLRIKGVGSEMVLLLEAAGVKSTAATSTCGCGPTTWSSRRGPSCSRRSPMRIKPPRSPRSSRLSRSSLTGSTRRRSCPLWSRQNKKSRNRNWVIAPGRTRAAHRRYMLRFFVGIC